MTKVYEKPLLNNLILIQSKMSSIFTKDRFFLVLEKSSFLILPWKMWLYSLPSCRREKARTWIGLFGFNRSDFLSCLFFSHFDIFLDLTGRCFLFFYSYPNLLSIFGFYGFHKSFSLSCHTKMSCNSRIRSKPALSLHIWWQ